jgi:hypothetical protein
MRAIEDDLVGIERRLAFPVEIMIGDQVIVIA